MRRLRVCAVFSVVASAVLLWPSAGNAQPMAQDPASCVPTLTSISTLAATQTQKVTIKGSCLGTQAAYTEADTDFLEFDDTTPDWQGCWNHEGIEPNQVRCNVSSWTNSQIVFTGFGTEYGTSGWTLSSGDVVFVSVSNAQSGSGPAVCNVRVVDVGTTSATNCAAQGFGKQYEALGDSYASGEGSFSYLPTASADNDGCHRATNGYARSLAKHYSVTLGFPACSGDLISDLYDLNTHVAASVEPAGSAVTDIGEGRQIAYLSASTKLVTLSIGGNDIGFAPLLADCVFDGPASIGATGNSGCKHRNAAAVSSNIDGLVNGRPTGCAAYYPAAKPKQQTTGFCSSEPALAQVYEDIAAAAPNAAIYVVGYPQLFGGAVYTSGTCTVGTSLVGSYLITSGDAAWLNSAAASLDTAIAGSVQQAAAALPGRSITFVDPRKAFAGHGVCSETPFVNGLRISGFTLQAESFHPNTTGQAALASLLRAAIGTSPTG